MRICQIQAKKNSQNLYVDSQEDCLANETSDKNRINKAKHGIDFNIAIHVFDDENRIEIYDYEHSIDEDRYNTIGLVHDILFVVYTERKDSLRIISARLATAAERRLYYDGYSDI